LSYFKSYIRCITNFILFLKIGWIFFIRSINFLIIIKFIILQMAVSVVLGAQWGDEGKGKLVDILSENFDWVCRCAGGGNAGHTVVVGEKKFAFHLLPSGVVHPDTQCIIGNGVVVHLGDLFKEIDDNESKGLKISSRLYISDRAHLVFDLHKKIDGIEEAEKGKDSIGTTKQGIGPTYAAKAARSGFRVHELFGDWTKFSDKFRVMVSNYQKRYRSLEVDIDIELATLANMAKRLEPMVADTVEMLHRVLRFGRQSRILVEGANATMIDVDFGK